MPDTNPATGKGWTPEEEQLIEEAAARKRHGNRIALGRRGAILLLRASWLIGETPPPMWPAGRPMPDENPRRRPFLKRTAMTANTTR